ncbi:MAG: ComF family protein [Candidatus Saganbacteria bacterium]|nr:ComF family protein [Candidatus Saganbacteria bacterium]
MKVFFDSILDLIFPPRCEVCRKSNKAALCPACYKQIKFMKPHLGIHSVSVYDGVLREAIHRFKFNGRKRLAEPLGVLMVEYLSSMPSLDPAELDMIVPVPLHPRRLRERGFNQVELLGSVLGKYFGLPLSPVLHRVRDTRAQFDLPREERFKNIIGAFAVNNGQVAGKRVILLDDIYTTGATLSECAKALSEAGANRVEVVTLSRAVDHEPGSVAG